MLSAKETTRLSKFLSLILRHQPELVGISLDANGWTDVADLLAKCAAQGTTLSCEALEEIVATSPKQRFALSEDRTRIRASQGHSVEVDLGYEPQTPPATLFHGTAMRLLDTIRAEGLRKMDRHHVHMSAEEATAISVGTRHGKPVVLRIAARAMHVAGAQFFRSANGVWLTESVPVEHISFPN